LSAAKHARQGRGRARSAIKNTYGEFLRLLHLYSNLCHRAANDPKRYIATAASITKPATRVFLRRNQPGHHGLSRNRETAIKIEDHFGWYCGPDYHQLGGFCPTSGLREQLPKLTGSIDKQTQSGIVGSNTGGAAEEYQAQNSLSLDKLHTGD
jgi:hypothetical protein